MTIVRALGVTGLVLVLVAGLLVPPGGGCSGA